MLTFRCLASAIGLAAALYAQDLKIDVVSTVTTGQLDQGASEIVAYDPVSRRVFVVNAGGRSIDVIDASRPEFAGRMMRLAIPAGFGNSPNSVAVRNGVIAVAVEANPKTDPGFVVFLDADGNLIKGVQVGVQPDMITFTPDGTKVLTANEGEPNDAYTVDPEGSVSIINISREVANVTQDDVTTLDFRQYNGIPLIRASGYSVPGPQPLRTSNPNTLRWQTTRRRHTSRCRKRIPSRFSTSTPSALSACFLSVSRTTRRPAAAWMPAIAITRSTSVPGRFLASISRMQLRTTRPGARVTWLPRTKATPAAGPGTTRRFGSGTFRIWTRPRSRTERI